MKNPKFKLGQLLYVTGGAGVYALIIGKIDISLCFNDAIRKKWLNYSDDRIVYRLFSISSDGRVRSDEIAQEMVEEILIEKINNGEILVTLGEAEEQINRQREEKLTTLRTIHQEIDKLKLKMVLQSDKNK